MATISPAILRQVKRIELRTRGLVTSLLAGEYRSVFRGLGMEFAEVRAYQHGDDFRAIDWNVSARLGTPYIKTFTEERELTVREGAPAGLLEALGFEVVHAIDRYIEVFEFADGHARLEWYPRMDVLIEVEGAPAGIERVIAATGLPRGSFTNEALDAFTGRYDARHPSALSRVSQDGWSGPA